MTVNDGHRTERPLFGSAYLIVSRADARVHLTEKQRFAALSPPANPVSRGVPEEHGAATHVPAAVGVGDRGALRGGYGGRQDDAHARGGGVQEPCQG